MKMFRYIALLSAIVLCGCVGGEDIDTTNGRNPLAVRLWADVGYSPNIDYGPRSATRGDSSSTSGIIDAATDVSINIGMVRVDEEETAYYPGFINRLGAQGIIKATMKEPNPSNSYIRDIDFNDGYMQFYREADRKVRFTAWTPWVDGDEGKSAGYDFTETDAETTVKIPITGDSDIMYANAITGTKNEGFDVMQFDHALCIYRIYVYSMTDNEGATASEWGELNELAIEDLPASCLLTLPTIEKPDSVRVAYQGKSDINISDPSNNIYYAPGNIPAGLANRRLVAKCIAAPPADGMLHIKLGTSLAEVEHRVSIARNFRAGHAYDVVLRFSNHGFINADVSVDMWHDGGDINQEVDVDMFFNLSNYESANSYIVNSANYGYCFDGTIKGNGEGAVARANNATINPGYIDILWDDTPEITVNGVQRKAVELVSHELTLGRVLFQVHGNQFVNDQGKVNKDDKTLTTKGNVIIAAYDNETNKKILWTWHIWITDRVKEQGYPSGYIVQDRNLGATSSESDDENGTMNGLYYQWGRPTPLRTSDPASAKASTSQAASVDEAIENYNVLYGSGKSDWLAESNDGLWGYKDAHTDLKKTMYDPCPPGYQVADTRVWQNITSYQTSYDQTKGVNLSIATNNVWYPVQGYLKANRTEMGANQVHIWSGFLDENNNPYDLQYTKSNTASASASGTQRSDALPVRCVSKHSARIVTNLSGSQTANCYMVHRAGYYKFKANVRGNGFSSMINSAGNTMDLTDGMEANIKPYRIDFLWWQGDFETVKSDNNNENDDDIDLIPMELMNGGKLDEDGYVTFYVPEFRKGNVGLVAYDADGESKEILWTWHIWFTDKPADKKTGSYTSMDRFLGATTVPTITNTNNNKSVRFDNDKQRLATYGFYYQWGRKDPFFGPPSVNAGSETVSNNKPRCSRYWVKDKSGNWDSYTNFYEESCNATEAIPESAKHPLRFIKSSTDGTNSTDAAGSHYTASWVTEAWHIADVTRAGALWGYGVVGDGLGQSQSKTIHDPCPPGYQTMDYKVWIYETDPTVTNLDYFNDGYVASTQSGYNYGSGEGNYDTQRQGIVFGKTDFDNAWYPFVGRRNGTTGGYLNVGSEGWTGTATPYKRLVRTYTYNSTRAEQSYRYGSSTAMPVRCQKQ